MKIILLTMASNKEQWFQKTKDIYVEKINHFMKFEVEALKAPKLGREQADSKKKMESEMFFKYIKPEDFVVLLDEKGRSLSSVQFAQWVEKEGLSSSYKRIIFIIGGAFGVSDEIKKRARITLQMGPWTLNHLVAQTVLLEQIYRAFTIMKGLPYHNQ